MSWWKRLLAREAFIEGGWVFIRWIFKALGVSGVLAATYTSIKVFLDNPVSGTEALVAFGVSVGFVLLPSIVDVVRHRRGSAARDETKAIEPPKIVAAQPEGTNDIVLTSLLPDIRVEYTDGADVSCFIVNKGGGAKVAVKARVIQPHKLFRIAKWYDVVTVALKPRIGETTVTLVHLSDQGEYVYLNGVDRNWSYAEAHKMPRSFEPVTLELRYVIEPSSVEKEPECIRVTFAHPPSGGYDRLGRFGVEKITP